jgi:glyoxylase-like metal-dependent hydrolase (beta-lactamase superfamily II)
MEIVKGVHLLQSARGSYVYLIESQENTLIDTGFPGRAQKMLEEIKGLGVRPDSIRYILLTHHDVDHIGNAKRLQDITGAELWVPEEDIPYITGEKNRPGVKRIIQSIIRLDKPVINGRYAPNQCFGEIRAIHAPGHTPGHTIFAFRNVLFTGDLFKTKSGALKPMPGYMNWSQAEVAKSLGILKTLDYEWLCPAHGEPVKRSRAVDDFINSACPDRTQ